MPAPMSNSPVDNFPPKITPPGRNATRHRNFREMPEATLDIRNLTTMPGGVILPDRIIFFYLRYFWMARLCSRRVLVKTVSPSGFDRK